MIPAQQGLYRRTQAGVEVDARLVDQTQLIVSVHRPGQRTEQFESTLLGGVEVRFIHRPAEIAVAGIVGGADDHAHPVLFFGRIAVQGHDSQADLHLYRNAPALNGRLEVFEDGAKQVFGRAIASQQKAEARRADLVQGTGRRQQALQSAF